MKEIGVARAACKAQIKCCVLFITSLFSLTELAPPVFAVGADVPEMSQKTFESVIEQDFPANFGSVCKCRKPTIAAVNGYAVCKHFSVFVMILL